ncbi:MAG: J domain-containing protein [Acidobacteriota bacterium]|nr:J domain-containing protein [Acidobacteriota bacterium]
MMDLYLVLGLSREASGADIKRAYRRLARTYHPDINPGDRTAELRFRQISEAYETLIDPDRRRRYDACGEAAPREAPSYGFEGFDFSVSVAGAEASTFGDLFADVIRQRQEGAGGPAPQPGADLHQTIGLTFDQALRGGEQTLTVVRRDRCGTCTGTGVQRTADARCPYCQGSGAVRVARGHMVFSRACGHCGGAGRQRQRACAACDGQGVQTRSERVVIQVPPGVNDGSRLRVAGQGNVGERGGATGDLYVTVQVAPHPVFRREGDDLHLTVPVAVHEAGLGSRIEVPAPDGPARLRIPPGTQSGQRFRLRERGAPSPRDGRRGDLVVEVRLVLPALLDERSKELLREFGRINGEDVRKDLTLQTGNGERRPANGP